MVGQVSHEAIVVRMLKFLKQLFQRSEHFDAKIAKEEMERAQKALSGLWASTSYQQRNVLKGGQVNVSSVMTMNEMDEESALDTLFKNPQTSSFFPEEKPLVVSESAHIPEAIQYFADELNRMGELNQVKETAWVTPPESFYLKTQFDASICKQAKMVMHPHGQKSEQARYAANVQQPVSNPENPVAFSGNTGVSSSSVVLQGEGDKSLTEVESSTADLSQGAEKTEQSTSETRKKQPDNQTEQKEKQNIPDNGDEPYLFVNNQILSKSISNLASQYFENAASENFSI